MVEEGGWRDVMGWEEAWVLVSVLGRRDLGRTWEEVGIHMGLGLGLNVERGLISQLDLMCSNGSGKL